MIERSLSFASGKFKHPTLERIGVLSLAPATRSNIQISRCLGIKVILSNDIKYNNLRKRLACVYSLVLSQRRSKRKRQATEPTSVLERKRNNKAIF